MLWVRLPLRTAAPLRQLPELVSAMHRQVAQWLLDPAQLSVCAQTACQRIERRLLQAVTQVWALQAALLYATLFAVQSQMQCGTRVMTKSLPMHRGCHLPPRAPACGLFRSLDSSWT